MTWSTACPDWQRRILARQTLIPFEPLFPAEAEAALGIFRDLRMVDAAGSPTMGEVSRPWVTEFVAAIFGAYDVEAGRRLITEFFLLVSKKNGKSIDAAGIMMTALIRNWRQSGEFTILAPTIEIAENSFRPARDMAQHDPELRALLHVQPHVRTITHRVTGATLKVVAGDSETVGGKKGIGTLIDELWLFGKQPKAENMLREATGGLASRPEGFTIYLTTQSDEPPAGVFAQKLDYARGVRDGRIVDPRFLPVLYEFPPDVIEEGRHRDPKLFYVTNPNLGASVDAEFLERELTKAEEAGEESIRGFLAKHLNVEIGLALMGKRWAGADHWESNVEAVTLETLIERSEVITVGIDGGGLDDLLGFAALGRDQKTKAWLLWSHAWAHISVLQVRKSEAPRFRDFEKDGDLTLVKTVGDDVEEVADYVERLNDTGLLDRIGVDQAGILSIVNAIVARGIEEDRIVGIPQGWKLTAAIKAAERQLAAGKLRHGGTRLMNYAVGNAKVEPRGNAIVITKQAAGAAKIDPLMAALDAVALMSMNPKARNGVGQLFV